MVSYDFSRVFQFLPTLWQALPMTLSILFFTTILGSLFGSLLAWAQVGEDKTFAGLSKGYIFTLRCTPPIVLLFLVFYGLPEFLKWWLNLDINNWSKTVFVLFTMVLLFAAIIAEVFKASYQAIPDILENHFSSGFSSGPSKYDDRHSKFDAGRCPSLYDWFCRCHGGWESLNQS